MCRSARVIFRGLIVVCLLMVAGNAVSAEPFEFQNLRSYAGVSFAMPAVANITAAHYVSDPFGLRLSAGYLPVAHDFDFQGAEGAVLFKLHETYFHIHQLLGAVGTTKMEFLDSDYEYSYVGLGYEYITHRLNIGLTGLVTDDDRLKYRVAVSVGILLWRDRR